MCLVTLGSYALATIGFKLSRFNDCEVAAKELTEVRAPRRGLSRALPAERPSATNSVAASRSQRRCCSHL